MIHQPHSGSATKEFMGAVPYCYLSAPRLRAFKACSKVLSRAFMSSWSRLNRSVDLALEPTTMKHLGKSSLSQRNETDEEAKRPSRSSRWRGFRFPFLAEFSS